MFVFDYVLDFRVFRLVTFQLCCLIYVLLSLYVCLVFSYFLFFLSVWFCGTLSLFLPLVFFFFYSINPCLVSPRCVLYPCYLVCICFGVGVVLMFYSVFFSGLVYTMFFVYILHACFYSEVFLFLPTHTLIKKKLSAAASAA